jgi:pimeloyl-ACP methyl ester carboxylesterase
MRRAVLLLLLVSGCATSAPATRPSVLANGPEWLRATGEAPSLRGRHVIFVAGFGNETIPGYFTDNIAATRALGGEASTVSPPSWSAVPDDVRLIEAEVAKHPDTPVVLVGHSKGGAGVLLTALTHPELVLTGRVEAVIVVQGAVGGSPLADALVKLPFFGHAGARSLTPEVARTTFRRTVAELRARLTPEEQAALFARVFYVRSAHRQTTTTALLAPTQAVLGARADNDGLVPIADMKLDDGVDLGVLDADHAALTVSSFVSVSTPEERRTFTTALYREVGRRLGWMQARATPVEELR